MRVSSDRKSIADLLNQRRLGNAGAREDGRKTALVLQEGGMRGTYSMAALMAFEELGMSNVFGHVLGASAGAINGAYFLAPPH